MFSSVTLYTNQLKEMKYFYTQTFNFPLTKSQDESFTIQIGTSELTFKQSDTPATYHFAFNIPGNLTQEAKTWTQQCVPLNFEKGKDEIFYKSFNADAFYFEDPSCNVVEFIGRRHKQSTGSFTPTSFLNISEVSITTPHVSEVGKLLQQHGLPALSEKGIDPEGLNFLGKNDCFIILVPPKRRWFFSKHLSITKPLELKLTDGKTITVNKHGAILFK